MPAPSPPPGADHDALLFARVFLETHDPYKPAVIAWPALAPASLARLVALPIWDIAIATEGNAALRMAAFAEAADDPLVAKAVAMNAFEERRHKDVLRHMIRFYGIALRPEGVYRRPSDPLFAFLRTGYGELFDSFFAFALFALARRSGFFPPALVEVFEPVIQEEARHNLFFVNWLAWERRRRGPFGRLTLLARRLAAMAVQVAGRLTLAKGIDGTNFTQKGGCSVGLGLDARRFLELCLAEHDRRMSLYDARLPRPRLMPAVARLVLLFLPRRRKALGGERAAGP